MSKRFVGLDPELQEVQRGEVARRVVEEHVLGARVRGDDLAAGRAGVPVVDGGVVLQAGVGRVPGGVADLVPQVARLQNLVRLAGDAPGQRPVGIVLDAAQELVGDAHRVVGVLAGDGEVGVAVPIQRVGVERDVGKALAGVLDDLLDRGVRHEGAACQLDLALQRRVLLRVEAIVARALAVDAGLEDGLQVLRQRLGAGDEAGDLVLLASPSSRCRPRCRDGRRRPPPSWRRGASCRPT